MISAKGVLRLVPRWRLAAACATVCATVCAASAAAQPAADSTEPDYPEVEVELGGTLFKQVLPFDVPFFISGSVPNGTRSVTVRYIEHDGFFRVAVDRPGAGDAPTCWQPLTRRAQRAADVDAPEEQFPCRWLPDETLPGFTWTRFGEPPAPPADETFRLAVPPLDAKRYYIFRFDVLADPTPDALAAFDARARTILDQRLAGVRDVNFFAGTADRPGDLERLRADLLAALQAVAGDAELQVTPGSLFNVQVPWASLDWPDKQRFITAIDAVVLPRQRIDNNLRQRATDAVDLAQALTAIGADPAFDGLLAALDAAAAPADGAGTAGGGDPQSDLLRDLLDAYRQPLALAHLDAAQAERLAKGGDPASDAPPPDLGAGTTDPAAAAAAAANYAATQAQLARLEELLARLVPGGRSRHLVDAQVAAGRLGGEQAAALPDLAARVGIAAQAAARLANEAGQVATGLAARAAALDTLAASVRVAAAQVGILIQGTTLGSFKTQQKAFISADFGFGFAPELGKTVPYAGTNIYTRPVNKDAPLSSRGGFRRRFAFTVGLTVASIADDTPPTRRDLFGSNSLLLGAGYRVTDSMRLGGGAILFEAEDPNPLIESWDLSTSYYLNLSFDWDVLGFFRDFGPIFGQ